MLCDLKRAIGAGNLVLLRRDGMRAEGRFDPSWAGFMALRRPGSGAAIPDRDRSGVTPRASAVGFLRPWEQTVPWFLSCLGVPPEIGFGFVRGPEGDLFLYAADGSWAEVVGAPSSNDEHRVWEAGPSRLWAAVERGYSRWEALGRPGWDRFGLTVSAAEQTVWLDGPDGEHRWLL